MKSKYYIRAKTGHVTDVEKYLNDHGMEHELLSRDFGPTGATTLYAVVMDDEEALTLRLSCQLVGCMNFQRVMGKLKK